MSSPGPSTKHQRDFVNQFTEDFDTAPVLAKVRHYLSTDDELAQLCDASKATDAAGDLRVTKHGEDAVYAEDLKEAWAKLSFVARLRAHEIVAEACATVVKDGDEWESSGRWSGTEIDEAKREAQAWLQEHDQVAAHADVLEAVK